MRCRSRLNLKADTSNLPSKMSFPRWPCRTSFPEKWKVLKQLACSTAMIQNDLHGTDEVERLPPPPVMLSSPLTKSMSS